MAKLFPFKLSSGPKYTEAEIVDALCSGDEKRVEKMVHWLNRQFSHVWEKRIQSNWKWDVEIAWSAFDDALMTFIRRVQQGYYKEGNWIGFCRVAGERRYLQLFKQPRHATLEESNSLDNLPEPINQETPDIESLLPLFAAIEWDKEYTIVTVAEWYNEHYSWAEICVKIKETWGLDLSEVNLRKDWERAIYKVQKLIVKKNWANLKKTSTFCHKFCHEFMNLHLKGLRSDKIKRENPEMAAAILDDTAKEDFSQAAEAQSKKCISCLVKRVTR